MRLRQTDRQTDRQTEAEGHRQPYRPALKKYDTVIDKEIRGQFSEVRVSAESLKQIASKL